MGGRADDAESTEHDLRHQLLLQLLALLAENQRFHRDGIPVADAQIQRLHAALDGGAPNGQGFFRILEEECVLGVHRFFFLVEPDREHVAVVFAIDAKFQLGTGAVDRLVVRIIAEARGNAAPGVVAGDVQQGLHAAPALVELEGRAGLSGESSSPLSSWFA